MSKMRFFALQELANRRPVKVDYPSEKLQLSVIKQQENMWTEP